MTTRNDTFGRMPVSQNAFTYQAIQNMTEYERNLLKQLLDLTRKQAEVVGGLTEDAQGNIERDANGGTVGQFLKLSFLSADEYGASIKQDAVKSFASMAVTGVCLAGTGAAFGLTRTGEVENQISKAKAVQADLKPSDDAADVTATMGENGTKQNFTERCKDLETGVDQGNFKFLEDADNRKLIRGSNQRETIAKNVDKYIDGLNNQISMLNNRFANLTNTLRIASDTGTSAAGGVCDTKKAQKTVEYSSDQARSEVQKNNSQQQAGCVSDSMQKANTEQNAMLQIAASLAQITQTHA